MAGPETRSLLNKDRSHLLVRWLVQVLMIRTSGVGTVLSIVACKVSLRTDYAVRM